MFPAYLHPGYKRHGFPLGDSVKLIAKYCNAFEGGVDLLFQGMGKTPGINALKTSVRNYLQNFAEMEP